MPPVPAASSPAARSGSMPCSENFPDRAAVAASLRKDGLAVLERLNDLTTAKATQWKARFPAFGEIKQEGDFARAY